MSINIPNAASRLYNLGVQDLSTEQLPSVAEVVPQHLAKGFLFAQRGPTTEELVVGNSRVKIYGSKTFEENSIYFNHSTMLSNKINETGNAQMHVRLVPKDAGPKPSIVVYLDVLPCKVDDYKRNADGSIKTNGAGEPEVIGQITGYKVKFVSSYHEDEVAAQGFGGLDIIEGDQVDLATGTTSLRYPIYEMEHSFFGADGQNSGIRMWALNSDNTMSMPTKFMAREKAYPYGFAVIRKDANTGSAKPVKSVFGEEQITFSFKEGATDPLVADREMYAGERLVNDYQNLTDTRYEIKYGEFGKLKVYQENIDTLLEMFHAAESSYITSSHDFTTDVSEKHLFNFIGGTSSDASPYRSYVFADGNNAIRFSQFTNLYAKGGSDGTMTEKVFGELVREYMERYTDNNDELMDIAYHVESCIYDSGFDLETKYSLIKMLAIRKDTFVFLSPYQCSNPTLTAAEEASIAASLLTRLSLYPESTYYNTPVFRAMIVGNSGIVNDSKFTKRMPMTLDVAYKFASYMGAGNGNWVNGKSFTGNPGNLVTEMNDVAIRFVPDDVANRFWNVGLNWVSRYNRSSYYYPQFKTVYNEDTSVLTSAKLAFAIITLTKILARAHRTFSGRDDLTNAQFSQKVNDFIRAEVVGKFDGNYIITPEAQFTDMDTRRGFTWTVPCSIYAPGMKTAMITNIISRRIEDYKA